jgi:hypothetical protein
MAGSPGTHLLRSQQFFIYFLPSHFPYRYIRSSATDKPLREKYEPPKRVEQIAIRGEQTAKSVRQLYLSLRHNESRTWPISARYLGVAALGLELPRYDLPARNAAMRSR